MPHCGPPSSLSHGLGHRAFVGEPVGREIHERSATEVFDGRHAHAPPERRELRRRHVGREAFDAVVRGVAAQQQRRVDGQRAFEVGEVHLIRRADFHESRAATREHVGQPEAAADLDELIARHDDLAAFRERVEDQQHGRRAIVHDERVFGAGRLVQQRRDACVARAARPRSEVELEIGITAGDRRHRRERGRGERGTPEVRVQQHARAVEDLDEFPEFDRRERSPRQSEQLVESRDRPRFAYGTNARFT